MNPALQQFGLRVMSGEARGAGATLLRGGLRIVEPFYAGVMHIRNAMYDRGTLERHALGRSTISVGNLTTGGTGKTPTVRWLAEQLRESGRKPAVLMRGYRVHGAAVSDEQVMLDRYLNADAAGVRIPVHANPDRVAGAARVLRDRGDVDTFILDDGFQHRRARRDFDLLLISAADPFGYGHVFPRGLLRESITGLRRADAILLTRCEQVTPEELAQLERRVRDASPTIPIFHCDHALTSAMDVFRGRPYFAFAGVGHPQSFLRQLDAAIGAPVGRQWFPDHHDYTDADLSGLYAAARNAGAEMLVTTEKDWVKLEPLSERRSERPLPIVSAEVRIRFRENDADALLALVSARLGSAPRPPAASPPPGAA